jgi:hypothetical protein
MAQIPLAYRLLLLYIEPIAAFNGFILAHFFPQFYLSGMAPLSLPSDYAPSTQIIYSQLASCYFLFAWNEAVVLRCTNDLRVWKAVVLGILICDVFHLYGTGVALGEGFWTPLRWRPEDWVNLLMLVGPGSMRVGFLAGVGFGGREEGKMGKEL